MWSKGLFIAYMAMVCPLVLAGAAKITCDAPTHRKSEEPLKKGEIDHYTLYYDCGWTKGSIDAKVCYIEFKKVGDCSLYLTVTDTKGKESKPTVIKKGSATQDRPSNLRKN